MLIDVSATEKFGQEFWKWTNERFGNYGDMLNVLFQGLSIKSRIGDLFHMAGRLWI